MSALDHALAQTATWPTDHVAVAVVDRGSLAASRGDTTRVFPLASVTKPLVAWAILVAVEEGVIDLDSPVGQPGCTLRHLLSHAGGYAFEGDDPITRPERTRGYSNTGIELACAAVVAATSIPIDVYLREAVVGPLGMTSTTLTGSPARDAKSCVDDLVRFVAEMRSPQLVDPASRDLAFRCAYPTLNGIVPGVGRYAPCPWGLGFEIRGEKSPHWTGRRNSARTVGHFGGAGTMLWYDPDRDVGLVALTDEPFDAWALAGWPELSDSVIVEIDEQRTRAGAAG